MASPWTILVSTWICIASASSLAGECRVEMIDGAAEGVDPAIAKLLQPRHAKVRIDDEELCQIWLTKSWKTHDKTEKPSAVPIEYRLLPGSLVGVIRVAHTLFDLRDQEIPSGVYTLRYAVQPEFEAHRDSHESRDFLLLLSPTLDKSPEPAAKADKMIADSAESIQSMHPAFMPLVKPSEIDRAKSVRRDERDENGWILMVGGSGEDGKSMPLDVILLRATTGG
jgi:hypothetical protein